MVAKERRREPDGVGRRNRPVRPDLQDEPVVVGRLADPRRFDVVVDPTDRGVHRVDRNVADAHILVEVLIRRDVTPAHRNTHLHLELAVFGERRDRSFRLENVDCRVALQIRRRDLPLPGDVDRQDLLIGRVHLDRDLLQVEDDVGHVLDAPRQRGKLVQDPVDLDRGDRRSLDRREQHPPQRVADRGAEAAFERLRVELSVRRRERLGLEVEPLRFLKSLPQSHLLPPTGDRL